MNINRESKMTYRIFTKEQLDKIISDHAEWLKDKSKGARANLSSADLRYANLSYANLSYANLRYADLSYANLSYANLRSANLRYADLSSADLRSADLRYADLLIFQFNRNAAYFTMDGTMRIGCECLPISEWMISYKEIGQKHGYSDLETEAYGNFIRTCLQIFEEKAGK
jgi:uncharacterized protein YjbI with pentapeptide repeats